MVCSLTPFRITEEQEGEWLQLIETNTIDSLTKLKSNISIEMFDKHPPIVGNAAIGCKCPPNNVPNCYILSLHLAMFIMDMLNYHENKESKQAFGQMFYENGKKNAVKIIQQLKEQS